MLAEKDSRFRNLKNTAEAQGWEVVKTNNLHWKFKPKDTTKKVVFFSSSPSDWRSIKNFISSLRKSGLTLPANF